MTGRCKYVKIKTVVVHQAHVVAAALDKKGNLENAEEARGHGTKIERWNQNVHSGRAAFIDDDFREVVNLKRSRVKSFEFINLWLVVLKFDVVLLRLI